LRREKSDLTVYDEHNQQTVINKIKNMFKTAKLLENDNPIGEDLKDVSYHLNQIVDEISRICDFLPRRDKDEI